MIRPIRNKRQHEEYLNKAYELMQKDLKSNSEESDELEVLSILIEAYEKKKFPIAPPNPIDAIIFRLDQMNMKKSELKDILGTRSRVSEVLSGKRKLSLQMIRNLNIKLNIPAEILISDYELEHMA